ncbi:acyltransferase family protein [Barrientosiimonas endolithica]|uniref:Acyltransferase n=1 Tax=Barrientosiimonas endolithica TaxID=1535208 RepID=A0ABN6YLG1_9MICO|nr:acyltransferase [Barrientosiimonas endolithica]
MAILTFIAFHFGVSWLQGAWVNVNVFFVLSGFLISRLLIAEQTRFGEITVLAFYRRRARRLLPGLFLLLGVLAAYGLLLAPAAVRAKLGGDLLATLGYVMNWRLVLGDDQYFEVFGNPSFLRHAWTLAVEEQFYAVAPFLVLLAMRLIRSRAARVMTFLTLAGISAWWTAQVGIATLAAQAHAYYGTDTRSQALLVGLALAMWLAPARAGGARRQPPPWVVAAVGWTGLGAMLLAYFVIRPFEPWMFERGGMLLFCLAFAGLVMACADPRRGLLQRILGWGPLAYCGRLAYGLYLWHWPIHLWLEQVIPTAPVPLKLALGMTLTFLIAGLSFELLEQPVLRHGLRGLGRRVRSGRVLTGTALAGVVAAALAIGSVPAAQVAQAGTTAPLVPGTPAYVPAASTTSVAVFGDSVPYLLMRNRKVDAYPDLKLTNLAVPGCNLLDEPVYWGPGQLWRIDDNCKRAKSGLSASLRRSGATVAFFMVGSTVSLAHQQPDGSILEVDDPRQQQKIVDALDRLKRAADSAGIRQVQIATLPCRNDDISALPAEARAYITANPQVLRAVSDPVVANGIIRSWAARNGVAVIDLYGVLCSSGFQGTVNGVPLYSDNVHFSPEATPMVWTWLAPQIRAAYQSSRR